MSTHFRRTKQTPEQRERELAQKRRHYRENREAALKYAADYRDKNRAALIKKDRDHRKSPQRIAYLKSYYEANKERLQKRRQAWREKNRERIAAKNSEWLQNNLDRHRTHQHARRAKKKETGGRLSPDIAIRLLKLQRGLCACCSASLSDGYELDHIVPISRGGANVDSNIQLLTPRCNRRKGSLPPVEYMQRVGKLL